MSRLKYLKFALLGPLLILPMKSVAADFWYVERKAFDCVKQKIAEYQKVDTNLVMVFFPDCPETDMATLLLKRTQNSSLPKLGNENAESNSSIQTAEPDPSSPTEVITLSKKQLQCLASFTPIEQTAPVIKLPKKICP